MTTLLEMRGATRRFGGLLAVNGLDLAVSSGESVGLIGPNGAGKTTAFGILMGDVRPNTGSVRFRGEDVTRLPTHARITRGMARTHQVPRPFGEMSVRDNVRVGLMPDSIRRLLLEAGDPEREREVLAAVGFAAREVAMLPGQLSMANCASWNWPARSPPARNCSSSTRCSPASPSARSPSSPGSCRRGGGTG